jgi:hypothetical protein
MSLLRRAAYCALASQTTEVRALQSAYGAAEPEERADRLRAVNDARLEWDRLFLSYQDAVVRWQRS